MRLRQFLVLVAEGVGNRLPNTNGADREFCQRTGVSDDGRMANAFDQFAANASEDRRDQS